MKFKSLMVASALAALSVPALASPLYGPGIDQPLTIYHFPLATAFGGIEFGPTGAFTDVFNFNTDVVGTLSVSLSTNSTANDLFPIIPFQWTLHLDSLSGTINAVTINPTNTTVNFSSFAAGAHTLTITGVADGLSGGGYNGSLTLAVPEPETYAMFLAGLGLMGLVARRRSASV